MGGGFGGVDPGAFGDPGTGPFVGSFGSPAATVAGEFGDLGAGAPPSNPGFTGTPSSGPASQGGQGSDLAGEAGAFAGQGKGGPPSDTGGEQGTGGEGGQQSSILSNPPSDAELNAGFPGLTSGPGDLGINLAGPTGTTTTGPSDTQGGGALGTGGTGGTPTDAELAGGPPGGTGGGGGALPNPLAPGGDNVLGGLLNAEAGGVELASGEVVGGGAPQMTAEAIQTATAQQDSLLQQWAQVIPESDPRWPQVEQMVATQVWGQAGAPSFQLPTQDPQVVAA